MRYPRFAPLLAVTLLALGGASLAHGQARPRPAPGAATVVATADGGYRIGSPNARVSLVEYASYTCPHCAHFESEGASVLHRSYVPNGRIMLEVRSLIRDPVDMAAALIARCGPANGFFRRHRGLMAQQGAVLDAASRASQDGWTSGTPATRLQRIAQDTGLIRIAGTLGVTPAAANRCLGDQATAQRLLDGTNRAVERGVRGTPTFMIDYVIVPNAYDWAALQPRLDAALASAR